MLSFLSKIIQFNTITVLSLFRTEEGEDCQVITLKKRGNNLVKVASQAYGSLTDFLDNYGTKLPVLLVMDGRGILNKKTDPANEDDLSWKKNIDFNTVYYTELLTPQYSFLCFTRRHHVDDVIVQLHQRGIQVLDFYLGTLTVALLQGALSENVIAVNNTLLEFEEGSLISIKKHTGKEKEYQVGGTALSSSQIALYAAGVHFYIQQKEISKSYSDLINTEELVYKKSFNYLAIGTVGLFFTLLLASYFLILHYSEQNNTLNRENVYSNQTYQYIKNLERQKESKLKILNDSGQLSEKFLSYYIYTLSSSVPGGLSLSRIEVFPVVDEVKQHKKIEVQSDAILLKGSTFHESSFNDWLGQLKKMSWIEKFEVMSIKKDKENRQHFEIKIKVLHVR